MIICHEHKYVFVELPLTGTTAISMELCLNYGGEKILNKHSTYRRFLAQANERERDYYAFSCIRNPMDTVVSHYFKLRSQHFDFENPNKLAARNMLNRLIYKNRNLGQLQFIRDHDADFVAFFLRYYKAPYSNWSILSHKQLDFVIRFEDLADDFSRVLKILGIDQIRELPVRNSTRQRSRHFHSYYTDDAIKRAKAVFAPFMQEWNYDFPKEWGEVRPTAGLLLQYKALNLARRLYWSYLKHGL